jgi:hypothetical protein
MSVRKFLISEEMKTIRFVMVEPLDELLNVGFPVALASPV